MKRKTILMAAVVALSAALSLPAYAGSWKSVGDKWMYQRNAQKYAMSEWLKLDGKTYYMDSNGYMVTGWNQIDGQWYYMDESGVMQTGWLKDQDKWYYLSPGTGAMVTNTTIEGRTIGSDGAWIPQEAQTEPLSSLIDTSTSYLMQNMTEGLRTSGYSIISSGKTFSQEQWSNAVRLSGKGSYISAAVNGQYRLLEGTFSPSSNFPSQLMGRLTVYGDNDQVLYTSPDIHYNEKPIPFAVDVSGQNRVKVEFSLVKDNEWDVPVLLIKQLCLYK